MLFWVHIFIHYYVYGQNDVGSTISGTTEQDFLHYLWVCHKLPVKMPTQYLHYLWMFQSRQHATCLYVCIALIKAHTCDNRASLCFIRSGQWPACIVWSYCTRNSVRGPVTRGGGRGEGNVHRITSGYRNHWIWWHDSLWLAFYMFVSNLMGDKSM